MINMNNREQCEFLEDLFRTQYASLLQYANAAFRNQALGEEAVQETFRIAWMKIEDLMISPNPSGWLVNTLKNVINNTRRSQQALNRFIGEYEQYYRNKEPSAYQQLDAEVVLGDSITTEEWKILRLSAQGYTNYEIAKKYGKTAEACKKKLQRAKKKLISQLAKEIF